MKTKLLFFDIETSPILGYVWKLWDNNISLNQIHTDWHILSWAAKWLGEKRVFYQDQSRKKDIEDDKDLLRGIWKLLDQADIVVTQNGKQFDQKKLNSRFIIHGMKPPSQYKHIDTKELAKKHFGFTSNKLEYLSDKLCVKFKKLKHPKFEGFELWKECLKGNLQAWAEMKRYNINDVLALEELYTKLIPWDNSTQMFTYQNLVCSCGSRSFIRNGYYYTAVGKYQRYSCVNCGKQSRDRKSTQTTSRVGLSR